MYVIFAIRTVTLIMPEGEHGQIITESIHGCRIDAEADARVC